MFRYVFIKIRNMFSFKISGGSKVPSPLPLYPSLLETVKKRKENQEIRFLRFDAALIEPNAPPNFPHLISSYLAIQMKTMH